MRAIPKIPSFSNAESFESFTAKISAMEGDFWVRLLYIHPDHFPLDILPLIQNDKRIIPYFDLPFQSGDNRIIRAMNRRGTAERYTELIRRIKTDLKDAVLRTTFYAAFRAKPTKKPSIPSPF